MDNHQLRSTPYSPIVHQNDFGRASPQAVGSLRQHQHKRRPDWAIARIFRLIGQRYLMPLQRFIPIYVWRYLLSTAGPKKRTSRHGILWWLLDVVRNALGCIARRVVGYEMYRNEVVEQRYWDSVEGYRRRLESSDASREREGKEKAQRRSSTPARWPTVEENGSSIPVIRYYQPALPPIRSSKKSAKRADSRIDESNEYHLPSKAFCKWHRMVYPPDSMHPTLAQASKLKKNFSNRDRREIHRISRMLPNEVVFNSKRGWTPKYKDMWKTWLERKGPDLCIIFEE
ncbi:hypothetical protein Moror_15089 [Moniliophthora roreri MCA 2997]|uniref:Uncharacterized protein n=1 Tax=Moniliophthora roreri (strain MCA 2997) TaxID=1381753 RepID=V2WSR9_MONRO|nr:hypothetical protein Moror_15089 [Moniliophthora roreri MCA 2997]